MLTFLKNVFKKGELRRKVIFTLGILFVYRLGAGITIPGVNVGSLSSSDATNGIFGIMNLLGGGTLERFSLFALGVSPYITSSIIIELLSMDVIPALTRWRKEGNTGKKKKDRVTRVLTLLLAALQGGVLTYAFDTSYNILVDTSIWSYIYVVLIMMAGSMLAIWLGDQITQKGIGNGVMVTLRRERMYEFLEKLVRVALPRIRDFKGIESKFDGKGNYTLGIQEQIIFPEINIDSITRILGMNITFVTSAQTDEEGYALLKEFGLPFKNAKKD